MSAFASFNGERVISGVITIPMYGTWVADIVLALSDAMAPQGALVVANLSLQGTVYRAADFSGSRSARIVGGYGGWKNPVTARAYQNAGGVPLAMVLGDAASEVGEKINVVGGGTVGTDFVREAAPAERVLRQLAGPLWFVDPSGVTQVGAQRSTNAITSNFEITERSGAKGRFSIATEDLASWMPGRTLMSPTVTTTQALSMVTIVLGNNGTVRVEALVAP